MTSKLKFSLVLKIVSFLFVGFCTKWLHVFPPNNKKIWENSMDQLLTIGLQMAPLLGLSLLDKVSIKTTNALPTVCSFWLFTETLLCYVETKFPLPDMILGYWIKGESRKRIYLPAPWIALSALLNFSMNWSPFQTWDRMWLHNPVW